MKSENKKKMSPIPREEIYLDAILNGKKRFPDPVTRKEHYLAAIAEKGIGEGSSTDLSDYYTKLQTDQRISSKVAEIVADAPEDFDTLKELSDWINEHEDSAAAMNSAIAANTAAITQKADKTTTYTKTETDNLFNNKVDKVVGKQLSTNDFTNADKSKLDSLENYDDSEIKSQLALNRGTLGYQRKNLLKNTYKTITKYGLTYIVNANGSVTVNGTATSNVTYKIDDVSVAEETSFALNGTASGSTANTYNLQCRRNSGTIARDVGNGAKLTASTDFGVYIYVYDGVTCNNVTFYPMLRYAEITDDTYEPYKPSVEERFATLEEKLAALEGSAT